VVKEIDTEDVEPSAFVAVTARVYVTLEVRLENTINLETRPLSTIGVVAIPFKV
jgi:hypothetical protein